MSTPSQAWICCHHKIHSDFCPSCGSKRRAIGKFTDAYDLLAELRRDQHMAERQIQNAKDRIIEIQNSLESLTAITDRKSFELLCGRNSTVERARYHRPIDEDWKITFKCTMDNVECALKGTRTRVDTYGKNAAHAAWQAGIVESLILQCEKPSKPK